MIKRLAPLFSLVLAVSCGAPTAVQEPFEFGETFWVTIGRTAASADGSTFVRFARVVGDSRCPGGDIVCVWQGEASVELGVRVPPAGESLLEISVGATRDDDGVGAAQGRVIDVLALEPFAVGAPAESLPRVQLRVRTLP
jgi:hypothetical protein